MELSDPKIKIFLIFSQKKAFLIFRQKVFFLYFRKLNFFLKTYISEENFLSSKYKKPTLKKFLIFQEMEPSSPKLKKFLIFQEGTLKSQA